MTSKNHPENQKPNGPHDLGQICKEHASEKHEPCPHEWGTRSLQYDSDGCGYYLWTCDACGEVFFDDMP